MTEGRAPRRAWLAISIRYTHPSDARGWIGVGSYLLVLVVLAMMAWDQALLANDFFKVIATAIVLTGWNQGPVGWAYQATKNGGDLSDANADIVRRQAAAIPPIGETKP